MYKNLMIVLLASLVAFSCSKQSENAVVEQPRDNKPGTVLARVNGATLTLEEIQYQLPAEYRGQLQGKDLNDAVENWINTQLLYEKAVKMGLDKDPQVKAVIDFRTKDAVARRLVEVEVTGKSGVSPVDIDSIYAAQKENYKNDKERMRASHILVASKDEADAIYNRLKKGDDFGKLAADYSADKQSAPAGGDLGYFIADEIDHDFAVAARKLQIGQFSEPVKTPYGYHIIKLTDLQKAGSYMDPAEVKSKISESLLLSRQGEVFNAMMDSLRQSAKIERFPAPGESNIAPLDTK